MRARSRREIAHAAGAVRRYVDSGMSSSLAGYYSGDVGVARGLAAGALGMRGQVSSVELERLLAGEHPVLGVLLLSGKGSSARSLADHHTAGDQQGTLPRIDDPASTVTLAEAARLVGVSHRYLSALVAHTSRLVFPSPPARSTPGSPPS